MYLYWIYVLAPSYFENSIIAISINNNYTGSIQFPSSLILLTGLDFHIIQHQWYFSSQIYSSSLINCIVYTPTHPHPHTHPTSPHTPNTHTNRALLLHHARPRQHGQWLSKVDCAWWRHWPHVDWITQHRHGWQQGQETRLMLCSDIHMHCSCTAPKVYLIEPKLSFCKNLFQHDYSVTVFGAVILVQDATPHRLIFAAVLPGIDNASF